MSEQDNRSADDLDHELLQADWHVREIGGTTSGTTVTFRKHYTSDFPGMETRAVSGNDAADATRKFLAELAAEDADQG